MFCVPFNNLTVLTGLAVLMESVLCVSGQVDAVRDISLWRSENIMLLFYEGFHTSFCHKIQLLYEYCWMLIFVCRYLTKRLMSVPLGNSFVFTQISMFPSTLSRETLRISGKQNKLFPLGADIKCIIILLTSQMQDFSLKRQSYACIFQGVVSLRNPQLSYICLSLFSANNN